MALAKLSIDLDAKLASLEQGFNRAEQLSAKTAAQVEARWAAAGNALNTALATVGSVGIGAALVTAFKGAVDGLDALNDIKDATGATIENISALEDAALRTGTSTEAMAVALVKFNKVLSEAPDSKAAKIIEELGLNFKQLRQQDPAEALFAVSKALSQFADNGDKARAVQELFGKSTKEVAPFLAELAKQGGLNAKVTTEQAEAAERFNQQLASMKKDVTDAARAIASDLLPSVSALLREFTEGKKVFGGFFSALAALGTEAPGTDVSGLDKWQKKIESIKGAMADIESGKEGRFSMFGADRLAGMSDELKKAEKFLEFYKRVLGLTDGSAGGGRGVAQEIKFKLDIPDDAKAVVEKLLGGIGDTMAQRLKEPKLTINSEVLKGLGDLQLEPFKQAMQAIASTDVEQIKDATFAIGALRSMLEQGKGDPRAITEAIKRLEEQADPAKKAIADLNREVLYLLDGTSSAQIERMQQQLNVLLNMPETPRTVEAIKRLRENIGELSKSDEVREMEQTWRGFAQTIEGQFGNSLVDALNGNFDQIGKSWEDLLKRMVAQAIATQLSQYLFGTGKDGNNGALWSVAQMVLGGGGSTAGTNGWASTVGMSTKSSGPPVINNYYAGMNIGAGVSRNEMVSAMTQVHRATIAKQADNTARDREGAFQ